MLLLLVRVIDGEATRPLLSRVTCEHNLQLRARAENPGEIFFELAEHLIEAPLGSGGKRVG